MAGPEHQRLSTTSRPAARPAACSIAPTVTIAAATTANSTAVSTASTSWAVSCEAISYSCNPTAQRPVQPAARGPAAAAAAARRQAAARAVHEHRAARRQEARPRATPHELGAGGHVDALGFRWETQGHKLDARGCRPDTYGDRRPSRAILRRRRRCRRRGSRWSYYRARVASTPTASASIARVRWTSRVQSPAWQSASSVNLFRAHPSGFKGLCAPRAG